MKLVKSTIPVFVLPNGNRIIGIDKYENIVFVSTVDGIFRYTYGEMTEIYNLPTSDLNYLKTQLNS